MVMGIIHQDSIVIIPDMLVSNDNQIDLNAKLLI